MGTFFMGIFTSDKTIRIECEGSTTVNIHDLHDLQGNLKTLMEEDYDRLRQSIEELGFSFPIFFWQDEGGLKWIIDAHQRVRVLKKMEEEGYTIPDLPAVKIFAKDRKQAKKKLLAQVSRYGKVTQEGYTDFVTEEGFELEESELEFVEIPEFDVSTGEDENASSGNTGLSEKKEVECPACHEKFVPK